jgi:GAF domain-containing protein
LLTVLGQKATAWNPATVQELSGLIGQAAITIQNRRLLNRAQTALEVQRQQSVQLQTAAEIAAASSSFREVGELLQASVELIRERFGLYYVGIFFPDEAREFAILRAGTGEEGRKQLAVKHKLLLNRKSLVGGSMLDGQPRIRQDVNEAVDWYANVYLPDTQSEIALALQVRQRVIGALTVQSRQPYTFSPELVRVLQTMSDQIAIAIDNATLFEQLQNTLAKTADLYEAAQALITAVNERAVYEVLVNFNLRTRLFDVAFVLGPDPDLPDQMGLLAYGHSQIQQVETPAFMAPLRYFAEWLSWLRGDTAVDNAQTPRTLLRPYAHDLLPESFRDFLASEFIEACAFVPIYAGASQIATLVLGQHLGRLPSKEQLQPFQTLNNQAAVTLANQRLLNETQCPLPTQPLAECRHDQRGYGAGYRPRANQLHRHPQARVVFYKRNATSAGLSLTFITPDEDLAEGLDGYAQETVAQDALYDELLASRRPVLLVDNGQENVQDERVSRYLRPFGVRSAYCLPAFSQHQMLLGAVLLDSFSPNAPFSPEAIQFAQTGTDQFTTSIENVIFFDEALERAKQMITLNQIGARISSTLDSGELARLVYHEVATLMLCDLFYLAEYDPATQTYKTLLLMEDAGVLDLSEVPVHGRVPDNSPLLIPLQSGETITSLQPEPLSVALTALYDPRYAHLPPDELPEPLGSSIFLPMHQNRQPIAFMLVQAEAPLAYTAEEINLLRAISNQTTLALANARLLAATQENVEELRTLFNITQTVASSVDVDERLRNVVSALHENLGNVQVNLLLLDEGYNELELVQARGNQTLPLGQRLPLNQQNPQDVLAQVYAKTSPASSATGYTKLGHLRRTTSNPTSLCR